MIYLDHDKLILFTKNSHYFSTLNEELSWLQELQYNESSFIRPSVTSNEDTIFVYTLEWRLTY